MNPPPPGFVREVQKEDRAIEPNPERFEVRRRHVLSPDQLFHVPPYLPRHKEKVVSDSHAYRGQRAPLRVLCKGLLLFVGDGFPRHAVRRGIFRLEHD